MVVSDKLIMCLFYPSSPLFFASAFLITIHPESNLQLHPYPYPWLILPSPTLHHNDVPSSGDRWWSCHAQGEKKGQIATDAWYWQQCSFHWWWAQLDGRGKLGWGGGDTESKMQKKNKETGVWLVCLMAGRPRGTL